MDSNKAPVFGPNGVVVTSGSMATDASQKIPPKADQDVGASRYWRWLFWWFVLMNGLNLAGSLAHSGSIIPASWGAPLGLITGVMMVIMVFGGATWMTIYGIIQNSRD